MSVRLSCPSCNTAFALDAVPADRRATCPRCGDVFPVRGFVEETEDRGQRTEPQPNTKHQTPNTKHRARAALVALALGLLGFAIGLAVYLTRETKTKAEAQPELPPAANATPPAQLVGVGFLPAECNVVFAVQPGPLLAYAARAKREPRELLAGTGIPSQVFAALDQIGLTLLQIDHIAGGALLGNDGDELRVAFVLVLKQPFADEDEFLKTLKAKPAAGKKTRYTVDLAKLPLTLARVSPTVWVFGLNEKDFAAVERGGFGPGGTQFRGTESDGFRQMFASVPPEAAVWVVADDERDWTQKPLVKLAAQSPEAKKWLPAVGGGRGGLFALSFGEQPRMRLFVRTAETATAERVRAYFQARATETESATAGGGGVFALFDAPFDPALLQRFLADAAK